jgi:flagella basal body P-ring formation protein FlgA
MRKTMLYFGLMVLWMLCLVVADGEATVVVSREEIHNTVTEYVHDLLSDFGGEIEVSVRQFTDLKVEGTGAVDIVAKPTTRRASARSIPVMLEIRRGPVVIQDLLLSASVKYYDEVAVAAKTIQRGDPLELTTVVMESREVTTRLGRYIADPAELSGHRAKTRIVIGRQIDRRLVELMPAVERKDRVQIQVNVRGVRASISGRAMESGVVGDHIVVQNTASQEKMIAEIVAPGVVEVYY